MPRPTRFSKNKPAGQNKTARRKPGQLSQSQIKNAVKLAANDVAQQEVTMPTREEIESSIQSWREWCPQYKPTSWDWAYWCLFGRYPDMEKNDPRVEFVRKHLQFMTYINKRISLL